VQHDFGAHKFVALAGKELVEIKVEKALSRKVAHVQARVFVLLLSDLSLVFVVSNSDVIELVAESCAWEHILSHWLIGRTARNLIVALERHLLHHRVG
jgi:hypothetical protein